MVGVQVAHHDGVEAASGRTCGKMRGNDALAEVEQQVRAVVRDEVAGARGALAVGVGRPGAEHGQPHRSTLIASAERSAPAGWHALGRDRARTGLRSGLAGRRRAAGSAAGRGLADGAGLGVCIRPGRVRRLGRGVRASACGQASAWLAGWRSGQAWRCSGRRCRSRRRRCRSRCRPPAPPPGPPLGPAVPVVAGPVPVAPALLPFPLPPLRPLSPMVSCSMALSLFARAWSRPGRAAAGALRDQREQDVAVQLHRDQGLRGGRPAGRRERAGDRGVVGVEGGRQGALVAADLGVDGLREPRLGLGDLAPRSRADGSVGSVSVLEGDPRLVEGTAGARRREDRRADQQPGEHGRGRGQRDSARGPAGEQGAPPAASRRVGALDRRERQAASMTTARARRPGPGWDPA